VVVIGVVSADWTAKGNLLACVATVAAPATGDAVDLMDWYVPGADGSAVMGTDTAQAAASDAGRIVALVGDLGALVGPMTQPRNGWVVTSAPLSLVARQPFGPGSTVVATLVLDVAGGDGVYHLSLADGQYAASEGVTRPLAAGTALEVRVGGW
jgi:hypothetical protein